MIQKVVARYKDGRTEKGETDDFSPNRDTFTLSVLDDSGTATQKTIHLEELKAIFFVKSLKGNKFYQERKLRLPTGKLGKHVLLTFTDGETMRGTSLGVNLCRSGFLFFPSDEGGNNKRIFVVKSAVKDVKEE